MCRYRHSRGSAFSVGFGTCVFLHRTDVISFYEIPRNCRRDLDGRSVSRIDISLFDGAQRNWLAVFKDFDRNETQRAKRFHTYSSRHDRVLDISTITTLTKFGFFHYVTHEILAIFSLIHTRNKKS